LKKSQGEEREKLVIEYNKFRGEEIVDTE